MAAAHDSGTQRTIDRRQHRRHPPAVATIVLVAALRFSLARSRVDICRADCDINTQE